MDELEKACKTRNKKKIVKLLEHKQIPTQKHFNLLFETLKKPSYHVSAKTLLKYRKATEIIDVFTSFCYNLTLDDVINATKHFVYINNLYTYDIQLDNNFFTLFYENFFKTKLIKEYPNFFIEDAITPINKLKWLQFVCLYSTKEYYHCESKKSKLDPNFKQLIKKYNITPDITCLRNLFIDRNIEGINFLMEKYKIKPDLTCIENTVVNTYDVQILVNIATKNLKIEK